MENKCVKEIMRLQRRRYRKLQGKTIIEGVRLFKETISAGVLPEIVFFEQKFLQKCGSNALLRDIPSEVMIYSVTQEILHHVAQTESPQGLVAVVPYSVNKMMIPDAEKNRMILIIDRLQDPGNLGTIMRTALAAGIKHIVLTKETIDPTSPKVLRSSMGAFFYLHVSTASDLSDLVEEIRKKKFQIIATTSKAKVDYTTPDYCLPTAFVIGSENKGVAPFLLASADYTVRIPLLGPVESLNAANAMAVLVYEAVRQRCLTGMIVSKGLQNNRG